MTFAAAVRGPSRARHRRRSAETAAFDVPLHAFYSIPQSELGAVVVSTSSARWRRSRAVPTNAPLAVNPALTAGDVGYAARLRALVLRHAVADGPAIAVVSRRRCPSTAARRLPSGRTSHLAAWTGAEMIVWGGLDGGYLSDGGRFVP
jgi:hypothetical protein